MRSGGLPTITSVEATVLPVRELPAPDTSAVSVYVPAGGLHGTAASVIPRRDHDTGHVDYGTVTGKGHGNRFIQRGSVIPDFGGYPASFPCICIMDLQVFNGKIRPAGNPARVTVRTALTGWM
jgi:hypothetical protein